MARPTLIDRDDAVAGQPEPKPRRFAAIAGGPLRYLFASLLLLAPCYWQPRLQAGDLSSHIYNAWLVQLIESGRVSGLAVVRQTTNILFDLLLDALFRLFGPDAAQRIAVSAAVLVFVWGAFAFIAAAAGRKPWNLLPCLAMLAYGWVFHMGFFNFYLSLGLCLGAMALLWSASSRRLAPAVLLLVCAYPAHLLPVVWALGLLVYRAIAQRLPARARAALTGFVVLALLALQLLARRFLSIRWSAGQFLASTGADQLWVFDGKYAVVFAGMLMVWGMLLLTLLRVRGARDVLASIQFHLCAIAAAAVVLLPETLQLPGYGHALAFVADRLSLGLAVCVCALVGPVAPRRIVHFALLTVTAVFFCFLYRDERAFNAFEDRMQAVVSRLAPGDRVVSSVIDDDMRASAIAHTIDRVCIGRCYSYANYEPSTRQFRVRALAPNAVVADRYGDSFQLQIGGYTVQDRDLPLWAVEIEPAGQMVLRALGKGERTKVACWNTIGNRPCPQP